MGTVHGALHDTLMDQSSDNDPKSYLVNSGRVGRRRVRPENVENP